MAMKILSDEPSWAANIVNVLLAGNDPLLATLREQFKYAVASKVEYTGVGYFIEYVFTEPVPKCSHSGFEIRDVFLEFENVTAPVLAMLFIRDARISFLEVVALYDHLPESAILKSWGYMHPADDDKGKAFNSSERDWEYPRSMWMPK